MLSDQIIQLMAMAPGPQTAEDVCDSLRRSGMKIEVFQVLRQLRQLQRDGVVQLQGDGIRWRMLKVPTPVPNEAATGGRSAATPAFKYPDSPHSGTIPPHTRSTRTPSRWSLFRRLCRYYMDCLLQDEAPQLQGFLDNENDSWLQASGVPWMRLAAGGDFAVPLRPEQAAFQRNRVRRGAEECVYIGYPLELAKTKEFVVPLFVQPMQAEWSGGILHFTPDGEVTVNGRWLDHRFRQRIEKQEFLRAMGFLNEVSEDEDESERKPPESKSFVRIAPDAAHYIHDLNRFAQEINPLQLSQVTEWEKYKPGLYNVAIVVLGPRLRYTRSLLRDLRDISERFSDEDLDGTALAQLFPHEPSPPSKTNERVRTSTPQFSNSRTREKPPGQKQADPTDEVVSESPVRVPTEPAIFTSDQIAQTRLLHPSQRAAVLNALAEPVSVVTGPPGTGKSEVVAVMMLNQLLRGQPTLFASKNHQALEAVLPRLNNATGTGDLVIQTSSRDLAQRQNYLDKMRSLLTRPSRRDASLAQTFHQRFREAFSREQAELDEIRSLEEARKDYANLSYQLDGVRKRLPVTAQPEDAIAGWPRVVTSEQLEILEAELRKVLRPPSGILRRLWHALRRSRIQARQRTAREPLLTLPNPFPDRTLPDVSATSQAWNDFFSAWKIWADVAQVAARLHGCEERVAQLPQGEEVIGRLEQSQQLIEKTTREWMSWAAGGVANPLSPNEREALANLSAGIQNWGTSRFARELREHFPMILRAFPLWSVSNLSARSALPLVPGLFDLIIIDEASQCDIASVVPLLARSRRVALAGDPMQLRHVCSLDAIVDQALLQQHDLTSANVQRFTYRVNSAFDLADASSSVSDEARVRLDLHFRSHEVIAGYCNEVFYEKTLHVATNTERLNIPHGTKPGIHWTHVEGRLEPGHTGVWCAQEIEAVRRELSTLAASGYHGTVGVVTPFRQQMIRLKDALEAGDALPQDFRERTQLLIDTAYGFQGGERDLILFSLCGGPELPAGCQLFFNNDPNQFNVAVSRARAVLHIVGNREWALSSGSKYIKKLAQRSVQDGRPDDGHREDDLYQSPWEKKFAEALKQAGVAVVPQHPVAGRFLDLAVLNPKKIDVEVDGESVHRTAGGGRKDDDLWRDLQLQSLGWRVCRFWVYQLREELARCTQRVVSLLRD